MAPRKCRQGRRPAPFCHTSRPYNEWPSAQLLEECGRRGIRVIRKGPRFNASKDRLALTLRQSDAERSAAVVVAGEQLSEGGDVVSTKPSNEPELQSGTQRGGAADGGGDGVPTIDDDEADAEYESQELDESAWNGEDASTRSEHSEQETDEEHEVINEQQQRAEYNATFRLVNVLFSRYASRFDELMHGTIEDTDRIAKRKVWIEVCSSFHSSAPAFSTLVNDHAMFADIDASLPPPPQQQVKSRRALVRMWKSLSATYSRALQYARQVDADDAQFYAVCGGRLDVLYLYLWLLQKPQLAIHFAPASSGRLHRTPSRSSRVQFVAAAATTATTTTGQDGLLNQAPEPTSSKSRLKRTRVESNDRPASMQKPGSKTADTRTDPALYAEYTKLKLEVLREKKALLAASAARDQMLFLEERRHGLLRGVRELSTTVTDLQQRLEQCITTTAANRIDEATNDQGATPTRQTSAVGSGGATYDSVAELKQNLAFFSRQKRLRMADVVRCDQQIQELGVRVR